VEYAYSFLILAIHGFTTQNTAVTSPIATATSNLTTLCITEWLIQSDTSDCASKLTSHIATAFGTVGRFSSLTFNHFAAIIISHPTNLCGNIFSDMLIMAQMLALFRLIGFYNVKQNYYQ
jgi:hypothetical protein